MQRARLDRPGLLAFARFVRMDTSPVQHKRAAWLAAWAGQERAESVSNVTLAKNLTPLHSSASVVRQVKLGSMAHAETVGKANNQTLF